MKKARNARKVGSIACRHGDDTAARRLKANRVDKLERSFPEVQVVDLEIVTTNELIHTVLHDLFGRHVSLRRNSLGQSFDRVGQKTMVLAACDKLGLDLQEDFDCLVWFHFDFGFGFWFRGLKLVIFQRLKTGCQFLHRTNEQRNQLGLVNALIVWH